MSRLVQAGFGLPEQHKRALRAVAEMRDVTMSQIMREAVEVYLGLGEMPPEVRAWRQRQRRLARQVAAEPPPPVDRRCLVEALRSCRADDLLSTVRAAARPGSSRLAS